MYRRYFIILATVLLACLNVQGQYDPYFSHYWDMEPSFNPAAIAKEMKINAVGAYALTMAGFERNPNTMYLSGDMPFYALKSYHGVGAQLMSDRLGLFAHQRVAVQYAFKKNILGGTLSAGVQAGFLSESFDGSKLDLAETNDPAFSSSEQTGNGVDLGFGLYYSHGRWYVGLSGQHLNAPLIELGETNELQIDRTYYLTGGYNIRLRNPFLSIPATFVVRSDAVGYRGDVTARLLYTNDQKVMYVGVGYSPTNSVTVLVGGRFHGINAGYSYEAYTNGISLGNGSHELFVGYQVDVNLTKKGRNKHKSVRFL